MAPDSAILCKGEPRGASAMKDETSIGAAVTHNFIVSPHLYMCLVFSTVRYTIYTCFDCIYKSVQANKKQG